MQPGRLLAGEYPGSMSRADAMERVQRLLRAGITSFIDLTEEGELPEYDTLLPELTEQQHALSAPADPRSQLARLARRTWRGSST